MLQIKRSVLASYSQTHLILPENLMQMDQKLNLEEAVDTLMRAGVPEDEMAALERQLAPTPASLPSTDGGRKVNFVSAGTTESQPPDGGRKIANSEDIDLPEDSDSDDDKVDIAQKEVPAAVFGELALKATEDQTKDGNAEEGNGHLGVLELKNINANL